MISSLADSAERAADLFRTFQPGKPELVPTGVTAVDEEVGGLGPGTTMIIGAGTGVGKSSVALDACLTNQANGVKVAYFSLEDGHDVLGCRIMARYSHVNSQKIRKKDFNVQERDQIREGFEKLKSDAALPAAMVVVDCVGKPLQWVVEQVDKAADMGCRVGVFDYLQKQRGVSDDRRNEVGRVLYEWHAAVARNKMGGIFLSQVARQMDAYRIPTMRALKESGDIENEARIILMLGRLEADKPNQLWGRIDKSTFGGENVMCKWERRECGTLYQVKEFTDEDF